MKLQIEKLVVEEVEVDLSLGNEKAFGFDALVIQVGGEEPIITKLKKADYERLRSYGMAEQG